MLIQIHRCSNFHTETTSTKPPQVCPLLPPFNMQSDWHVYCTPPGGQVPDVCKSYQWQEWNNLGSRVFKLVLPDGKALSLFIMQLLYRFFRVCLQSAGFLSNIETNSCKRSKIFTKAVAHSVNDLTSYYRRHETIVWLYLMIIGNALHSLLLKVA